MSVLPRYVDPAQPIPLPLGPTSGPSTIDDSGLPIQRSILPGGVRLITQELPGALSASVGLWVAVGSRDEGVGEGGISHFLEHLLFKGTRRRSAFEIAEAFDARGAESNAATTKEATFYWSHMVASDLPTLLPVLVDMVTDSVISDKDVNVERGVILDELAMSEDSPMEVTAEAFARAVFGNTELGRPIGGTKASVAEMPAERIRDLYHRTYSTSDLVVSVSGAVDHEEVSGLLLGALAESPWASLLDHQVVPTRRTPSAQMTAPSTDHARHLRVQRPLEQAHLMVGGPWLRALDPAAPASSVTLNLLGGGMSSRLFQEIREKRGLAYSTYAYASTYSDAGSFALYAGCAPKNLEEVRKVMWGEVEKLADHGPSMKELARSKGQIRGGVTLNLEDTVSRMSRLARAELVGQITSVSDALARIDAVHVEDVKEMARRMLESERTSAIVSPSD